MSHKKIEKPERKQSAEEKSTRAKARDDDLDRALEDSFPASDPPQMTQPYVKAGGPRRSKATHK
ncbi:MAG: hypothetical protein EPN75_01695 [Beijerinckiaceae bacterium]|nr:MAG: hypothetical protein EPN75_01695 [Beijerinckiaceae bacterium]